MSFCAMQTTIYMSFGISSLASKCVIETIPYYFYIQQMKMALNLLVGLMKRAKMRANHLIFERIDLSMQPTDGASSA